MPKNKFIDQMFIDHHDCMGLDQQEIDDIIEDSTFQQRYNWLKKIGYELEEEHD
ncbi:hypothetical protein WKH57_25875 [Niallia taxi]|uniref:hypothetical protein n=1 Tax=Niallia taxi TaxID=2499688 RepID=UPI003177CF84